MLLAAGAGAGPRLSTNQLYTNNGNATTNNNNTSNNN